jgi:hypothetical protein
MGQVSVRATFSYFPLVSWRGVFRESHTINFLISLPFTFRCLQVGFGVSAALLWVSIYVMYKSYTSPGGDLNFKGGILE